jgi:hypothetical protein
MENLWMFLAMLFTLVCLVAGFVYGVKIAKGKARWFGLVIASFGVIGVLPFLFILPPPRMTLGSMSGTYQGKFGGGQQLFVLHPNGTFDQKFVADSGKVYRNKGTWSIDHDGSGGIDFDHFLGTVDGSGQPKKPEITSFNGAAVHWIGPAICFDEDTGNEITRTGP